MRQPIGPDVSIGAMRLEAIKSIADRAAEREDKGEDVNGGKVTVAGASKRSGEEGKELGERWEGRLLGERAKEGEG